MPEKYRGVKFEVTFLDKNPPKHNNLTYLLLWARKFAELGFAEKNNGNLSFRTVDGCIITGAGKNLANIRRNEFVEVVGFDISGRKPKVMCKGKIKPSSESIMHLAIYDRRPDVNAILHGHSDSILKAGEKLGIPMTEKEKPYGTVALVKEIFKILEKHKFILLKNHGFLSLGRTIDEAGSIALLVYKKVLEKH